MNGPRRVYWIIGIVILAALLIVLFGGCALTKGRIKGAGVTVNGVKDGNGATLASDKATATITIPAGSKLTTTKFEARPWQPPGNGRPAFAPEPAREVTEVTLSRDTVWQKEETKTTADTGAVDTSIAKHRIDTEAAQPLLWVAIACTVLALFFAFRAYPTPAISCGIAAVIFFMQWQMTSLPSWFKMLGVAAVVGGIVLWVGHRRGEKDGVKEHLEELAKAKALAVPAAPPIPVVVTNPATPST